MENRSKQIGLGSTSGIKVKAVQEAFKGYKVVGVNAESGVPPQPIGQKQTEEGARRRANGVKLEEEDCILWIGIENGMWKDERLNKFVDGACIVVIERVDGKNDKGEKQEDKETVLWSDTIEIPEEFPKGPNGEWSLYKDPHSIITQGKKSRQQFLTETLVSSLEKFTIFIKYK